MNVNLLKGTIIANGLTCKEMAARIGIDEATFYRKLNGQSDFFLKEIIEMCKILKISDPNPIFFAKELT